MKKITILIGLSFMLTNVFARILQVPAEYEKIQDAINASRYGDTVLVTQGTYFENIMFRNKNITVASNYLLSKDKNDILTTIIDGSKPQYADSSSCVMFYSQDDTAAILDGFTLTHGSGAKTIFPPNTEVKEGGGILMVHSQATVRNNLIKHNSVTYWGGGGIASFFGNPKIFNNIIFDNSAGYAGAIVLNLSDAIIKNNIIYHNKQTEKQWLTAGIMVWDSPGTPLIENNTIVGNIACTKFGGISITSSSKPIIVNNIIWANRQTEGLQLQAVNTAEISFNDLEDQTLGEGIIHKNPLFADGSFVLTQESPCIDAGNSLINYNDKVNDSLYEKALAPSQGTIRNDMGAYGGWGATYLNELSIEDFYAISKIDFGKVNINTTSLKKLEIINLGTTDIHIDSIKHTLPVFSHTFNGNSNFSMFRKDTIFLNFTPTSNAEFTDTLKIFHSGKNIGNPKNIILKGSGKTPLEVKTETNKLNLSVYPNPAKNICEILFSLKESSNICLNVLDSNGKCVMQLENSYKINGEYKYHLNCLSLKKGIYFLQLTHNEEQYGCKLVLN